MVTYLKLTNYRKHSDLELDFTPGLNVIRAPVEGGKTTTLEAIAYALFGSAALPQKLEQVVTYGMPLSKMRVDLHFTYLGVDYQLYRGKSGAELTFAGQRITGQSECTRFMEQMLGTTAKLAGNLMIAEQADLRGALNEGPTGAGKIIEALADFDLIDQIVELVQTKLAYGSTDAVQARIALLTVQAVPPEAEDLAPLQQAVTVAEGAVTVTQQQVVGAQAALDDLDLPMARQILADEKHLTAAAAACQAKLDKLGTELAKPAVVRPSVEEVERLRLAVADEKNVASALAVKADLVRLPEPGAWDLPLESLTAEVEKVQSVLAGDNDSVEVLRAAKAAAETALKDATSKHTTQLADLARQLITEESCALCGKDLKDVPEVVAINNPLYAQIQLLKDAWPDKLAALKRTLDLAASDLEMLLKQRTEAQAYLDALQAVVRDQGKVEVALAKAGANVEIDRAVVPWRWKWVGPAAGGESQAPQLRALEQQASEATANAATRDEQVRQRDTLAVELLECAGQLVGLAVKDAQETLELADLHTGRLRTLNATLAGLQAACGTAQSALVGAQARLEAAERAAAAAKGQLLLAQAELVEVEANNILVKKLRQSRGVITDKLWSMVLSAVSKYFSQMRGVHSVIRREDGEFKADNEPVAGLSGSTKDILGLAIRAALTRVFLPLTPFMLLDEPAAACDDVRETSMLGLLSTLGFEQVIMVTHSDLADASADNLITL